MQYLYVHFNQTLCLQGSTGELIAEIDLLLTLEQYRQAVPDTLASYLHHGTRIVYETVTIPVSDIVGVCQKPLSLPKYNPDGNETLSLVSQEVSSQI